MEAPFRLNGASVEIRKVFFVVFVVYVVLKYKADLLFYKTT